MVLKDHTNIRNFAYTKGTMSLNFGINIDNQKDIKDFIELLKAASEDLEKEVK